MGGTMRAIVAKKVTLMERALIESWEVGVGRSATEAWKSLGRKSLGEEEEAGSRVGVAQSGTSQVKVGIKGGGAGHHQASGLSN